MSDSSFNYEIKNNLFTNKNPNIIKLTKHYIGRYEKNEEKYRKKIENKDDILKKKVNNNLTLIQ